MGVGLAVCVNVGLGVAVALGANVTEAVKVDVGRIVDEGMAEATAGCTGAPAFIAPHENSKHARQAIIKDIRNKFDLGDIP